MPATIARPIDVLIAQSSPGAPIAHVDAVVVGSGYGGALAAARLAGPGRTVIVLERGQEYALGDFPNDLGDLPGHVRFHRSSVDAAIGYPEALFDFRMGRGMDVLVGSGLGGTSLINANVAARPPLDVMADTAWPMAIRGADLTPHFEKVETLLGITPGPRTAKWSALERLSKSLGAQCRPAPIAVTQGSAPARNSVGITQPPCTGCGNCVTGCNVGAKNTLMMNVLPLAAERGARFFTGAAVLTVRHDKTRACWIVRMRRTASEKTPLAGEIHELEARTVILAAGTLGSTEILLRSRDAHQLAISGQLGYRFSGNGDALAFGYGQQRPVDAMGRRDQHQPSPVGPTITGIAHPEMEHERLGRMRFTLEDGAVPASLLRLFEEVVTTAAQVQRLDKGDLPAWHEKVDEAADPLAITDAAQRHAQLLLLMGDDGAGGKLCLEKPADGNVDASHVVVDWPQAGANRALHLGGEMLAGQDRDRGFDGGQYVPNPLWQVLPPKAEGVLSGALPGGRAISVHPLGGCPMGEDFNSGVVDDRGQVFRTGIQRHEGLYVLDGSIIPRSLGINPFLTIAALAHRAAELIASDLGWQASTVNEVPSPPASVQRPVVAPMPARQPTVAVLRERLIGKLVPDEPRLRELHPQTVRWSQDKGLIVDIEMDLPDVDAWLARPGNSLAARAKVYWNSVSPETTARSHMYHTPSEHVNDSCQVGTGTGRVSLMRPDRPNWVVRQYRVALALRAFIKRRQPFWQWLREIAGERIGRAIRPSPAQPPVEKPGLWDMARGLYNVAHQHTTYRTLEYRFDLETPDGKAFTLHGTKLLAWKCGTPRLWNALLELPVTLEYRGAKAEARIQVDGAYLGDSGLPQVTSAPHLPAAVASLSGIGMMFARSILQTHFWDFGAPDYPQSPVEKPKEPARLKLADGSWLEPQVLFFTVPTSATDPTPIALRLSRYLQPAASSPAEPVLLIHGLAQGSHIYTEDMLPQSCASYLHHHGHDVWVLDYRISNTLPEPLPGGDWTMDEMGEFDIPVAIEQVYAATGRPIRIFAHCVGATATAMAILKGRVKGRIHSVAFNAIHPWIMPSPVNEFRALMGRFFRDVLGREPLDPVPTPNPPPSQVLFDRLAFSLARYGEMDGDRHPLRKEDRIVEAVCDRMSLLYGRMWWHANLDERTHRAFPRIVGASPGPVYRHMYYLTTRKRVVTAEGLNEYLTEHNLEAHWDMPTFFLHGEQSMVFNPQSATRSALRLDAILNDGMPLKLRGGRKVPVGVRRFERYGHMDVVFAKDAHVDGRPRREENGSFPLLAAFFKNPAEAVDTLGDKDGDDHHLKLILRLSTGPILRAAWIDQGTICMRIWGENKEEATTLINGLAFRGVNARQRTPSWQLPGCESRYHMIDAELSESGVVKFDLEARGIGSLLKPLQMSGDEPRFTLAENLAWLARLRYEIKDGAPVADMRFLVGSCRYPGTPFEREQSDAIFAGMAGHAWNEGEARGVHMQFFIGDQIYADATANILDTSAWRERFSERYRDAFGTAAIKEMLWRVPTHFAVDDHEIADDWSGESWRAKANKPSRPPTLKRALQAAKSFQSSGRRERPLAVGAAKGKSLWYPLDDARERCCPTFVMDTRAERLPRRHAEPGATMIGATQSEALKAWLKAARPDAPKFILCGSGLAPIAKSFAREPSTWRTQDGWLGYPATTAQLAAFIVEEDIRDVVFVSGDLHLSALARITFSHQGRHARCWQLVSSGLYAPLPFANAQPGHFEWGSPQALRLHGSSVDMTAESWLLHSGPPHFLRVDAEHQGSHWTVRVGVHGAAKDPLPIAASPPAFVQVEEDGAWVIRLCESVPMRV